MTLKEHLQKCIKQEICSHFCSHSPSLEPIRITHFMSQFKRLWIVKRTEVGSYFLTSGVPNNAIAPFATRVVEKEMCWGTSSYDWIMSTLFPSSRCRLIQSEPPLNVGIEALF
jgi:hypothetical protein